MNYRRVTLVLLAYGVWWSVLGCWLWWLFGSPGQQDYLMVPGWFSLIVSALIERFLIPPLPRDTFWRHDKRVKLALVLLIVIFGAAVMLGFFNPAPAKAIISPAFLTSRNYLICGVVGFAYGCFIGHERVRKFNIGLHAAIREASEPQD